TGRLIATWARISSGGYQIRATLSDDGGLSWSAVQTISTTGTIVTGPIPRFYAPLGATDSTSYIFVAFRHITRNGTSAGLANVSFVRSPDGGATWTTPFDLGPNFTGDDDILGVDRTNTNPSMAVDPGSGNIYVVYQANNSYGEGDIVFQR